MTKQEIIDYVMTTPGNPNKAVLSGMLDSIAESGGTLKVKEISQKFSIMPMNANSIEHKVTLLNKIEGYEALTADNIVSYDVTLRDATNEEIFIMDKYMSLYVVEGELKPKSSSVVVRIKNPTSEPLTVYYTVVIRYLVTE